VCVEADPTHIEQVLVNLAVNGNDAMNGAGTLVLAGDVIEGFARLRVQDTGCGMDEATRQRVFEPFFTTKGVGKGTGLGLSTVWGIVQAHGGTISVESEPGKGATFTVLLPLSQARPVGLSRPLTPTESWALEGVVLVVDDEPALRRASTRALECMGIRVYAAANGEAALELFAAHPEIELVLLGMAMPGMGGAECFARMRAQRNVAVLVATGYAVDHEAQQLVAKGASVLEKPFTTAQLRSEVTRLLARARRSVDPDAHE
jgi:CheY-like chemotaxis protein